MRTDFSRSADGRVQGAGGRAQLWREPAEPCHTSASPGPFLSPSSTPRLSIRPSKAASAVRHAGHAVPPPTPRAPPPPPAPGGGGDSARGRPPPPHGGGAAGGRHAGRLRCARGVAGWGNPGQSAAGAAAARAGCSPPPLRRIGLSTPQAPAPRRGPKCRKSICSRLLRISFRKAAMLCLESTVLLVPCAAGFCVLLHRKQAVLSLPAAERPVLLDIATPPLTPERWRWPARCIHRGPFRGCSSRRRNKHRLPPDDAAGRAMKHSPSVNFEVFRGGQQSGTIYYAFQSATAGATHI